MEGKKYTPERAIEEATRLQEKVQEGTAQDYKEAELQLEAEKLIQSPESTVRGFIDSKLSDLQHVEGWEGRLQMNLKNRLAGNPDKRYLLGLRQAASGMSEEKEKIVTAAYLYELEHRNEMEAIPNYNPTVLFRLTLDFAKTREDLLGVAMKKYLNSVPLEEIYKNFKGVKGITPEDLPRLAEMALERLSVEEESSKNVLEDAKTDLFRPAVNAKNKKLQADSFFTSVGNYAFNAERFTPEALSYLLTNVKEENPTLFQEVVQKIDTELERISRKNIPADEKEFARKLEEVAYSERDYLRRDWHAMKVFNEMIQSVPALGEAHNEIITKRQLKEAETARVEEERQRQLAAEREQERVHGDAEKQRESEERGRLYQEERAKKKELANMECDRILGELPQFSVDTSIIDDQITSRVQEISLGELSKLLNFDEWEVVRPREEAMPSKLSSLDHRIYALFVRGDADREKADSLYSAWKGEKEELERSIETELVGKKDRILEAVTLRLSLTQENPTISDYEEYLETLQTVLENTKRASESTREENAKQFLQGIIDVAEQKRAGALPAYEAMKASMEEGEKHEAMIAAQEEYLRDQIEKQTDYLKEIYAIGTGLGLAHVESRASHEAGSVVGSVSLGMGLRMRQELKLELKLELVAEQDNLTLEMGEDLESIKKRMAMVNWVAPHEIAHLVDWSSDMSNRLFTEEELAPMKSLIENWKGDNQNLAQEMIPMVVKETAIDGVGYRMVKEYGTANPFDETKPERIAAAVKGYVAMMDVLRNILATNAEDVEMKARYSTILLRKIADGEIILDEAKDNKVSAEVIGQIEGEIETLKNTFAEFNEETRFVDGGQVQEIIELCKNYFKKAEQVPLVRRQRE